MTAATLTAQVQEHKNLDALDLKSTNSMRLAASISCAAKSVDPDECARDFAEDMAPAELAALLMFLDVETARALPGVHFRDHAEWVRLAGACKHARRQVAAALVELSKAYADMTEEA